MSLQPLQPRYKPYAGAAAGWGALRSVAHFWLDSKQPFKNLRALLKTNQNGGFDCPGCAWGDSPEDGRVKFCENGAKAVNWEATKRRVDTAFFARYSVSALREQSDYWLEYQGRLTGPMRYDPLSDHYQPITWDAAFALVAEHLRRLDSPDQAEFYTSGRASNEAAYLYQLFVRAFGTNNFPDCSNMCHEASGVALGRSVGVGKQRDLRRLRTRRRDLHPWAEPRHQPPAHARAAARGSEARCPGGLLQPSQGARPGAFPASAERAGNADQRVLAAEHRVLPSGTGRRHGGDPRDRQVPPRLGARSPGRGWRAGIRPRLHRRAHRRPEAYLAELDATPGNTWSASPG